MSDKIYRMVTTLAKTNVISAVYENIYDRLKDQITTVSITGPATITIQTYTNSFNESMINTKSNYPILIMNSPEIESEDDFTLTKKRLSGSFTIDILTTQKESADKFADVIKDSIETYRDDLRAVGMISVNFDSSSTDDVQRGAFMIHSKSLKYKFTFIYSKTGVF